MPKGVRTTQPKVQRGKAPGKRGPALSVEEQERSKVIVVEVERNRNTTGLRRGNPGNNPHIPSAKKLKLAKQLSDLIQEIGKEVVDPQKGWTRLEVVVRRLYGDAMSGKTAAQALLFERGWGKVPTPIAVDMRTEVLNLMESSGLTPDEMASDPVLAQLMGPVVEGEFQSEQ